MFYIKCARAQISAVRKGEYPTRKRSRNASNGCIAAIFSAGKKIQEATEYSEMELIKKKDRYYWRPSKINFGIGKYEK